MNLERVKGLIDLIANSPVTELVLSDEDGEIHLKREGLSASSGRPAPVAAPSAISVERDTKKITAPLPGVLYLAPDPNAAPYVSIGTKVRAGDTLALVEAMKTMVPLIADCDGEVSAILVENEAYVDAVQPLFHIVPVGE